MPQTLMIRERSALTWMDRFDQALRSFTVAPIALKEKQLVDAFFGDGYHTAAGITVGPQNAFTFSAVYDAVNQSSGDLAKLPLNLLIRRKNGVLGSDPYTQSPIYWLLKEQANRDMSAFEFRRTLQAHALTAKGGFAEIERDGLGNPTAFWPITPDRIDPLIQKIKLPNGRYRTQLKYLVDGDNNNLLDASDVIHIRGLGYDGYRAYPVIDKARQAIGTALAMEQFAGAFFGNNSNFGGILTATDQDMDEDQARAMQERIEKVGRGSDRAWRLLVLGAGFKYARTGITPQESQMEAMASKQVEEVARFFNFPLHKLKNLNRATFSNIEQQDLEYYKGHMLTWATNWEQELTRKLVPAREWGNQYIKHNANAFLRADSAARTALYTALLDRGVFCADDVLELEDMNPQPGGQGKLFLVQGAMVPKDKISAIADSLIKKNETKATPPAPATGGATDQQVQDANARAERAEQLAREAQATAQQEREARIAAEATGTATGAELEQLRTREAQASAMAAQTLHVADQLRADAVAAQTRADEAQAARTAAEAAQREAEALRVDAERRATEAGSAQEAAEARAAAADQQVTEARQAVTDAEQAAQAARTAAEAVGADRDALRAVQEAAEAALGDARASVARFDAERASLERDLAAATAAADHARAEQQAAVDGETRAREAIGTIEARLQDMTAMAAADVQAATVRADTAEQQAVELRQAGEREVEARQAAIAAREQADTAAEVARRQAEVAQTRAVEADGRAEQAITALAAIESRLATAVLERDSAIESVAAATREQARRDAELDTLRQLLSAQSTQLAEERTVHTEASTALQSAIASLERENTGARELVAQHETTVQTATARVASLEREVQTVRQADAGSLAAVIDAHRQLVGDIMRRMIERETDQLRRVQQSPDKLQRWLETFYEGHADLMRRALLPAIRVHLAFIRSDEDPIEATRRLVDDHVRESQRQIRQMLDGDAEVLASSVPALLYRWDTERPTVLASALMTRELNYARNL